MSGSRDGALTIVVPVYNEGRNFDAWWSAAEPHLPPETRVWVVYDRDDDDTLPVLSRLSAAGKPVFPLRNSGHGALAALKTGLGAVAAGPVLVSMADGCDDLALMPRMVEAWRAGADVVVASRYMPGGQQLGGPWLKRQFSCWGGRSLKWLARFPSHDATNSFRLYDAAFVRSVETTSAAGFEIGFELTLLAWASGRRVVELPCTWRDRTHGQSRFLFRKWLPAYGRLWWRALLFGLLGRSPV
jgi:dolichol-phosphate mannosyltransferase